jgi:hypothetical protein
MITEIACSQEITPFAMFPNTVASTVKRRFKSSCLNGVNAVLALEIVEPPCWYYFYDRELRTAKVVWLPMTHSIGLYANLSFVSEVINWGIQEDRLTHIVHKLTSTWRLFVPVSIL